MLVVPILGYGFAHWEHKLPLTNTVPMLLLLFAWTLLSAGTMWVNAALDGAEGAALFAHKTSPIKHVALFGYGALFCAVWLATCAAPRAGAACAACAALAILYSHPRTQWKARPLLGPLVSAVGYGLLSALAGYAVVGARASALERCAPIGARSIAAFVILSLAIYGLAIGAQSFQRDEIGRAHV